MTVAAIVVGLGIIGVAAFRGGSSSAPEDGVRSTTPSTSTGSGAAGDPSAIASDRAGASPLGLVVPTATRPTSLEDGRAIGRRDAPVTLEIWEDLQCPFCGEFTRQIEPRLYADYVIPGKLRIVVRDWPFIGPESLDAAAAARCAGDQGKFWPYHDYLFWNQKGENEGGFNLDQLIAIATVVGLDRPAFLACLGSTAPYDAVKAETEAGDQAGIGMTPTLVVGSQVMPGAPLSEAQYARLRAVIDRAIAAKSSDRPVPSPSDP